MGSAKCPHGASIRASTGSAKCQHGASIRARITAWVQHLHVYTYAWPSSSTPSWIRYVHVYTYAWPSTSSSTTSWILYALCVSFTGRYVNAADYEDEQNTAYMQIGGKIYLQASNCILQPCIQPILQPCIQPMYTAYVYSLCTER